MMKKPLAYFLLILVSTQVVAVVSSNVVPGQLTELNETPYWDAKIYPNPNNGIFTIMVVDNSAAIEVVVFNVIGDKVFEMIALGDHLTNVDLSHLEKGLYIVQLIDEARGEIITRRMHIR